MTGVWSFIGVGLLVWVGYDLYAGYTLLWDTIYRDQDPVGYWLILGLWFLLAISCFVPWSANREQ